MTGPILGPASSHPDQPPRPPPLGDWSVKGWSMYAKCICGADRIVSTHTLITKLGAQKIIRDEDLRDLSKHFVCGTCKAKGRVTLRIERG